MRRLSGDGLVKNELRLLLTACELYVDGEHRFHGYQLAQRFRAGTNKAAVMTQPTLYRCLRRLEERGALTSEWESLQEAAADNRDGQPRRYYRVTAAGIAAARQGLSDLDVSWSDHHLKTLEVGPVTAEVVS